MPEPFRGLEIKTLVPRLGYRHVVTADDVRAFISLIPDWPTLSFGLRAIVLGDGDDVCDGSYLDGVITLSAWRDPPETVFDARHFLEHREILELIGVATRSELAFVAATTEDRLSDVLWEELAIEEDVDVVELVRAGEQIHVYERRVWIGFDRRTAAAYQLLHVFLHELGHHIDARTPSRRWRGEPYAEQWANRCARRMWMACRESFGW